MNPAMELPKVDYVRELILAKFGGLIPETVTAKECYELMKQISEFERERANLLEKQLTEFLNVTPNPPFIVREAL